MEVSFLAMITGVAFLLLLLVVLRPSRMVRKDLSEGSVIVITGGV